MVQTHARETQQKACTSGGSCLRSDEEQQASFSEAQKCPQGEVPLVFVPVGTPGGHSSNQIINNISPGPL